MDKKVKLGKDVLGIDTTTSMFTKTFKYRGVISQELTSLQKMMINNIIASSDVKFVRMMNKYLIRLAKYDKTGKRVKRKLLKKIFRQMKINSNNLTIKDVKTFIKRPKHISNHLDDAVNQLVENSVGATFWQKFNNNSEVILMRFKMLLDEALNGLYNNLINDLNGIDNKLDIKAESEED